MSTPPSMPAVVQSKFDAYPPGTRRYLLGLRELIFRVAVDEKANIGEIIETLKWGQPSYLPKRRGVGTTLRLDAHNTEGDVAIYFHCQSRLGDVYRERFGNELNTVSQRHIQLCVDEPMPAAVLEECFALALTYHKRTRENAL